MSAAAKLLADQLEKRGPVPECFVGALIGITEVERNVIIAALRAYSGNQYVHGGPIAEIAAERQRQREKEGWNDEHDDEHMDESLALAAACYAIPEAKRRYRTQRDLRDVARSVGEETLVADYSSVPVDWPESWHGGWWKPKDRRRDLVRAAALIVAELERLDRLTDISKRSE